MSAAPKKFIPPPSSDDIRIAYDHGQWLRGEVVSGTDRMLADLSYEVQRLRDELAEEDDGETA